MSISEDIQVRCKSCGKYKAEGYIRTNMPMGAERELRKIIWWLGNYLCVDCSRQKDEIAKRQAIPGHH